MKGRFYRKKQDDPLLTSELIVSRDPDWGVVRVIVGTRGVSVDVVFELDEEALAELREVLGK